MKIVILNGSHRHNGNCYRFSNKANEILNKYHEVKQFNLTECNIVPCHGCLRCEDGEECGICDDYSKQICPALKEADLLIFASPTYFNMPSSVLVNLMDRTNNLCEYLSSNLKKAIVYLVGQTDEETIHDAYKCIKTYFDIMCIEEIREPIIRVARMPEEVDAEIISILEQV
jgi:multimeric flavodoxin WrbA